MDKRVSHGRDRTSPCLKYGCDKCCRDTEMTLSEAEAKELRLRGHRDFTVFRNGYLSLKNVDGLCVFLEDGRCLIYPYRPLGCRLYPVIYDPGEKCAFLHDFCPRAEEFAVEDGHAEVLGKAVALEDRERDERLKKKLRVL